MPADSSGSAVAGRGSLENAQRSRLLEAAGLRFKSRGFEQTRVAEIARDVGISKAYVYKLFRSKSDLGDAVCRYYLGQILQHIDEELATQSTATGKFRKLYATLVADSIAFFFQDRKLYEICAISARERWPSTFEFVSALEERLDAILLMGRGVGEFERKTPLEDVREAIKQATMALVHPMMLQFQPGDAVASIGQVTSLILRSLSP